MKTITTIDLSPIRDAMNPAFIPLLNSKERINVLIGGASSGKSFDVAMLIVYKTLLEPGHRWLAVRKVGRTLKHSVFDQITAIIRLWGMENLFRIYTSELFIKCLINGNEILFTGLDDTEKLKSIYGITDIWIEEASEISEKDFNQLDLRLRGFTPFKKQIWLTMNPISALHWIKLRFFDKREKGTLTHKTTYRDNIFLDPDTIKRLESITDPYYRAVYVLAEWGVYGNLVFSNYVIEDFPYKEEDLYNVSNGMDYGYIHASTLIRLGFRDDDIYIFDELYGKNWTNSDFIQAALDYWGEECKDWIITADSAEPDRIEDWRREGFYRIKPAKKGAGSLKYGIDFLCRNKLHIHESRCPNTAREIQSFKRREDKDGNVLEDFIELMDDCIAGARYATEDLWQNYTWQEPGYTAAQLGL